MQQHIRRTERLAAMTQMLVTAPNRIFSLGEFCDLFGAAKSTVSEDLDIIRRSLAQFALGEMETLPGAGGGVRFRPLTPRARGRAQVEALCARLMQPGRMLPGGLLFIADIIADPEVIGQMGVILASEFYAAAPDFVLTMETQGIPLALMTARALNVPVLIARRSGKAYEGPAVNISYPSGAQFKTMSLGRRLVQPGQRALLVDDVLRSGGTAEGMRALMREFDAQVVGCAMLIATRDAETSFPDIRSLMVLDGAEGDQAALRPGDWLNA